MGPEEVSRIETRGFPGWAVLVLAVACVIDLIVVTESAVIGGVGGVAFLLGLQPWDGWTAVHVEIYAVLFGFPAFAAALVLTSKTARVGAGWDGVVIERRGRPTTILWERFRFDQSVKQGSWVMLTYGSDASPNSWRSFGISVLWLTRDQARIVLGHPACPSSKFKSELGGWLGIPSAPQS